MTGWDLGFHSWDTYSGAGERLCIFSYSFRYWCYCKCLSSCWRQCQCLCCQFYISFFQHPPLVSLSHTHTLFSLSYFLRLFLFSIPLSHLAHCTFFPFTLFYFILLYFAYRVIKYCEPYLTIIDALNLQDIELDTRIVRERCSELMREEERKEIARKK